MIPRLILRRCLTGSHNKIIERRPSGALKIYIIRSHSLDIRGTQSFYRCRCEDYVPGFMWTLSPFWHKRRPFHAVVFVLMRLFPARSAIKTGYDWLLEIIYVIVCRGADFPNTSTRIWRRPWLPQSQELSRDWVSHHAVIGPLLPTDHPSDSVGWSRDYYLVRIVHNYWYNNNNSSLFHCSFIIIPGQ